MKPTLTYEIEIDNNYYRIKLNGKELKIINKNGNPNVLLTKQGDKIIVN